MAKAFILHRYFITNYHNILTKERIMTLSITIKQHKDLEVRKLINVNFHSIDKHYLIVSFNNNSKHKFRLNTILEVQELP